MFAFPVIVRFDLATFLFCREHDDDTNVLLPYDIPKVLQPVRFGNERYTMLDSILTVKVAGIGPWVAMYRLFDHAALI